ncbi:hypothetical protein NA57DRAFT_80628 [Rhizodiscina lignyota]|uniref:Uncharacterized protein n=1 Tax=Rhizodiscina lignyota TaxID=1504668 RepID=A0A9P4M227_9PEZI|nr:hypothetical protein NA57DRAFT_80628 [Rhizodiscina lignyota]
MEPQETPPNTQSYKDLMRKTESQIAALESKTKSLHYTDFVLTFYDEGRVMREAFKNEDLEKAFSEAHRLLAKHKQKFGLETRLGFHILLLTSGHDQLYHAEQCLNLSAKLRFKNPRNLDTGERINDLDSKEWQNKLELYEWIAYRAEKAMRYAKAQAGGGIDSEDYRKLKLEQKRFQGKRFAISLGRFGVLKLSAEAIESGVGNIVVQSMDDLMEAEEAARNSNEVPDTGGSQTTQKHETDSACGFDEGDGLPSDGNAEGQAGLVAVSHARAFL